ncbi:MAG: HAMP domain-containing protein [Fibrobacteria bacterium]|nr:HAMP domain-containing protein [Fibrobacteria bacterium]
MAGTIKHTLTRWLPEKLESKFILTAICSILFVGCIGGIVIYQYEKQQMLHFAEIENKKIMQTIGLTFTHIFIYSYINRVHKEEYLESSIRQLMKINKNQIDGIQVFDKTQKLIASNRLADFAKPPYQFPPLKKHDISIISNGPANMSMILPLHTAAKIWGFVKVSFNLTPHLFLIKSLYLKIISGVFVFVLLSAIFSAFVARKLAKPIKALSGAMEAIGPKNFEHELKVDRNDEIGKLQEKFIDLMQRLKLAAKQENKLFKQVMHAEKLAAIGTLTAGVAHEINNPITGMESCLSHLKKKYVQEPSSDRYIKPIEHALAHIKKVVGNLLEYSRKGDYEFSQVQLENIISKALTLVDFRIRKQNIKVNLVSTPSSITGFWDPQYLEQVFLNLFINAIDAMGENGNLTVSSSVENGYAVITVIDSGSGIKNEDIGNIFVPFFTTKTQDKGTGLGLAVSLKIIQDHKGDIQVVSTSDVGTIFTVSLPLTKE